MRKLMLATSLVFSSVIAKAEPTVDLKNNEYMVLSGAINPDMLGYVANTLLSKQIKYVVINSGGGYTWIAYTIGRILKEEGIKCIAVNAQSAAFYILQTCNIRLGLEDSQYMLHHPVYPLQGYYSYLRQKELAEAAKVDTYTFLSLPAKRIKMSISNLITLTKTDWITIGGSEAKSKRIIDSVVKLNCPPTPDLYLHFEFNGEMVTRSDCPLSFERRSNDTKPTEAK